MSNYTKTVDFASKDTLPSGDSGKIIKGTEFETEFDNIATAVATKADSAAPTFTGTSVFANLDISGCLLYTSPSPRDQRGSRMPSSA